MQQESDLFNEKEAGAYVRKEGATMRNSRYTGTLGGVPAPKHLKIGGRVFYKKSTLDKWLSQFEERVRASDDVTA